MNLQIPIIDIVLSLSNAIDLIDSNITDHHKRVAYISFSLAKQMNFSETEIRDLVLAALLHDCGAVNLAERSTFYDFEFGYSLPLRHDHGYKGWFILKESQELRAAAEIIKYHHIFWKEPFSNRFDMTQIPKSSYVLHLADRIDILIDRKTEILNQREHIWKEINAESGTMFMPDVVQAFYDLVPKLFFWFDIVNPHLHDFIKKEMSYYHVEINSQNLLEYAFVFHRIIDFRNKFTATHSTGVAAVASTLAFKMGFSDIDCSLMKSAGLMHDIGKLSVPESILEKTASLSPHEYNIIKAHTYHTYRIIDAIPGLEKVRDWAAFHHEKLDGTGYPFGLKSNQLDLGARILAISDMFTALTEERPYRHAMPPQNAIDIINAIDNLDYDVKCCLNKNLDEINEIRKNSQKATFESCHELLK